MEKKYENQPEEKNGVNDPAATYEIRNSSSSLHQSINSLSIYERKIELINAIVNEIDDEKVLIQIEKIVRERSRKTLCPCQFTSEELNQRATKAIKDYKEGNYISHEEMKKRFTS